MNEIQKFNKIIIVITALTYVLIGLVFYYIIPNKFHLSLLLVPVLEAFVTSLLHSKLIKSSSGRPQKFINMFMVVTGIKLMIYLFFILIYIIALTEYALPFLGIFFPLYIVFTVLEIKQLLAFLKNMEQ